jgi:hypothetical protein
LIEFLKYKSSDADYWIIIERKIKEVAIIKKPKAQKKKYKTLEPENKKGGTNTSKYYMKIKS